MSALKVTELGDYLKEQRHHARLTLRQLAEQAGVSNPYLSQVERGLRKPSAEVLQQIAKGLRISAEALYVRAGILEQHGDRVEVQASILADPHLTERQRRVLLDIYDTFRTENARDESDAAKHPVAAKKAAAAKKTTGARRTARKAAAKKVAGPRATTPHTTDPAATAARRTAKGGK